MPDDVVMEAQKLLDEMPERHQFPQVFHGAPWCNLDNFFVLQSFFCFRFFVGFSG